jgi:O-antigen ligase
MVFLRSLRNHPLAIRINNLVATQVKERRPGLLFSLCTLTLISSFLLGGGTRGGFLSDTILELLAIPAFLASLSSLVAIPWTSSTRSAEWALMLCLAITLLPFIQLLPLPPSVWTRLPHREEVVTILSSLGRELPWLPISVAPSATWLSALSLLPPIAIFLCVLQLSYQERRVLSLIILGVGILEAFVGLVQVAEGPSSPLRFFAFTNESEAVGFFANRNHFAALLYVLLSYSAAWATDAAFVAGSQVNRRSIETSSIGKLTAGFLALVVLMAAEAITRSRAGLGLMIIGVFAAFALPLTDRRRAAGLGPLKLIFAAIILAIVLGTQFALYRVLVRFADDPLAGARTVFARNTIVAAAAYLPFGSGFGTFVPVYQTFERPEDTLANIYANHAHDDILEVSLEGGAVAMILIVLFACWFVLRFKEIWWRPPKNADGIDILLVRAATIGIVLIIAHSFVDYPLRTDAMMALFAFSCAILVEPLRENKRATSASTFEERIPSYESVPRLEPSVSSARVSDAVVVPSSSFSKKADDPAMPLQGGGRWGEDIEWPEEWRNSKEQGSHGKRLPKPTDK